MADRAPRLTWHEIVGALTDQDVRLTVMNGAEAARRWADTIRATLADTDDNDPQAETAADAYDALARMIDSGEAQKHVLAEYRVTLAQARIRREQRWRMVHEWAGRPGFIGLVSDIGHSVITMDAHIVWLQAKIAGLERQIGGGAA